MQEKIALAAVEFGGEQAHQRAAGEALPAQWRRDECDAQPFLSSLRGSEHRVDAHQLAWTQRFDSVHLCPALPAIASRLVHDQRLATQVGESPNGNTLEERRSACGRATLGEQAVGLEPVPWTGTHDYGQIGVGRVRTQR